jgi:hypothetical protein
MDQDDCSNEDIELVFVALTRVVAKLNMYEPDQHLTSLHYLIGQNALSQRASNTSQTGQSRSNEKQRKQ